MIDYNIFIQQFSLLHFCVDCCNFFTGLNELQLDLKQCLEVTNQASIESTNSVIFPWKLRYPDQPNLRLSDQIFRSHQSPDNWGSTVSR